MKAAVGLRQEYVFMPGKVKDVYLFYVLAHLANLGVRSVIVFTSTCKVVPCFPTPPASWGTFHRLHNAFRFLSVLEVHMVRKRIVRRLAHTA